MSELNEGVRVVVTDAEVITVPIDASLTHSGEAADAKAVGDALDLKADKREIQTAVTVNGQRADAQGLILVTGADTAMSATDSRTVKAAVDEVAARTGADIPVDSSAGSQTIAQALSTGAMRTADQIAMSASDATTVKGAIDTNTGAIQTLGDTVAALGQRTGATIPYQTGSEETIKQHIDSLEAGRVKTVNDIAPDANGNVKMERVPYADNLYSEDSEQVDASFLIRTTAGSGSLSDGNAWAQRLRGNLIRSGYVAERLNMVVNAMPRYAPPAITATIDEATFEAYVGTAGTYTLTYDEIDGWTENPALYGLTISNDPVDGDVITMTWDGSSSVVVSINAAPRTAPDPITATIDRAVFVGYVTQSGTITLTYTTDWSADPAIYGITVSNVPIAGDQIVVTYVKEQRGTITVATPSALKATGWNLYRQGLGRARVVHYSEYYGYRIDGTYTSLAFSETLTGTQTAITPDEDGLFMVPSDGYVFVTGGSSDTAIYTTWSDWTEGYSGSFETYTESAVDLSGLMALMFPYGFLAVGDVYDEIDFVHAIAYSRITRLEYTEENRASAEASGRAYTFDENYIYLERQEPVTNAVTVENEYAVSEHGLEFIDGSTVPIYTEVLYGQNLKDKLKRDVLTISEQTLMEAQKAQVQRNLGVPSATSVNENIAKLREGIAIIVDGDTASVAVPVGGYAYIKNNTHGLAEGMYKNTSSSAFPVSGGTANSTVFTTVPTGAVNDAVTSLNSKIGTLVKKTRTVTTTDSVGDAQALNDITQKAILSVIPVRNAGDGTYSSWFGIIFGAHSGTGLSIKCINDNNEKLASKKVAMDVYYIEQTFS